MQMGPAPQTARRDGDGGVGAVRSNPARAAFQRGKVPTRRRERASILHRPPHGLHMRWMKLRLLVMGGVISFLGVALMASRGVKAEYGGLLGVGVVFLVLGLVWK